MHSKSNNIKFTSYNDSNEVVDKLFDSLRSRYQGNLVILVKRSDLIFDLVWMMYCKCHKIIFRCGGSYINSPDWIKKQKTTRNPENKDDKYFQYAVTVALNYDEIESNPQRVSNIKPFINIYNWEGIN